MLDIKRGKSELNVEFKTGGMEISGSYLGKRELELDIDLLPLDFYESLKFAVVNGRSAYPRINLPFGKRQNFSLERQGGLRNDEVWFNFKTTSPVFFYIELREQEIKIWLDDMKKHMTR